MSADYYWGMSRRPPGELEAFRRSLAAMSDDDIRHLGDVLSGMQADAIAAEDRNPRKSYPSVVFEWTARLEACASELDRRGSGEPS